MSDLLIRPSGTRAPRSKTLATWLALVGGSLGLHRFYLHGRAERWGWLFPLPTLVGAYGFWRMRTLGVEDALGSALVPLLGAMVASTMLVAIVYGLMPDARWNARWNAQANQEPAMPPSGGLAIAGVIVALAVGATVAMATIAFCAQRYFEAQAPL